jgi:hypothetical protein
MWHLLHLHVFLDATEVLVAGLTTLGIRMYSPMQFGELLSKYSLQSVQVFDVFVFVFFIANFACDD